MDIKRKRIRCETDSFGSGEGQVSDCCERGIEHLGSTECG